MALYHDKWVLTKVLSVIHPVHTVESRTVQRDGNEHKFCHINSVILQKAFGSTSKPGHYLCSDSSRAPAVLPGVSANLLY